MPLKSQEGHSSIMVMLGGPDVGPAILASGHLRNEFPHLTLIRQVGGRMIPCTFKMWCSGYLLFLWGCKPTCWVISGDCRVIHEHICKGILIPQASSKVFFDCLHCTRPIIAVDLGLVNILVGIFPIFQPMHCSDISKCH
jgi:hypothetical protein